ncbi:MAG: hypothetical protein CO029_03325 [Candidatus Magasanikbacteria bacterium CG_4_9_14_0_2_um_filter_41_10]|uniref:Segregation and condensation protein A n=1 Tax=Candidatus Magasanikbacteria bacterium CG_4_10_14_0_2_um_filter_41_31 TaxID=1974639 RepID=A0A2M7V4U7_9BACT|nr:MAG: hypothetical protein AUJ37_04525 [Candidatus Magasanikbacteria bacterium CG1_02_41_34]PIZ93557.1 MAG: hypothetical protein COX83_01675 [Candidatus Magasanikbacteria bacterium CG_4_10_14_0_2_um_filter_41_31]PJC53315.1 MAG: hypothetical protein CO029_03325 [Candidatus Magasanikbacteria bacterium CG_4_9_14_0_2_um_filter_41_10]
MEATLRLSSHEQLKFVFMMDLNIKQFTGPFDLLLSLVEQQELRITEITLSEVTEQYLTYLDTIEEDRVEELADFLVVAAKLLYLKSKRLLPDFLPEEEDDTDGLEAQLKLYKQFVDASRIIDKRWLGAHKSAFRKEPPKAPEAFSLPPGLDLEALAQSMVHLVSKIAPPKQLSRTHIDRGVSLKERIDSIRKLLKERKSFRFADALSDANNKTEVIIGFLAILELVKQKSLRLDQDTMFGDIMITRT